MKREEKDILNDPKRKNWPLWKSRNPSYGRDDRVFKAKSTCNYVFLPSHLDSEHTHHSSSLYSSRPSTPSRVCSPSPWLNGYPEYYTYPYHT